LSPIAIKGKYQRRFPLGRLAYYQQCNGEGLMAVLSLADSSDCVNKAQRNLCWSASRRNTVVLASAHRPKLVLSGVPDQMFLFTDNRLHAAWEGAAPLYFSVQPDGQG
jgi:hypothetical protein